MGITYDDMNYARSRLVGTLLLDGDRIAEIAKLDLAGVVTIKYACGNNEIVKKKLSELDTTPMRLGYVNLSSGCLYVSRAPVRRDYRQGLSLNTMRISSLDRLQIGSFKYSWLRQPALNMYPKFSDCLEDLLSKVKSSKAFCRDFCLTRKGEDIQVNYKGKYVVGVVVNGVVNLYDDFTYLRERISKYVD